MTRKDDVAAYVAKVMDETSTLTEPWLTEGPLTAFIENDHYWLSQHPEDTAGAFIDSYRGEYTTVTDYVRELYVDSGLESELPTWVQDYVDYEGLTRDMLYSGDIWEARVPEGFGVYVFSSNY